MSHRTFTREQLEAMGLPQTAPRADRLAHPAAVREQVRRALDFNYAVTLGYESSDELLATYDASRTPADQGLLLDRIAEALADAEGWQWAPGFDKTASPTYQGFLRQAAAVLAVLPAPTDRAAVLREIADEIAGIDFHPNARARSLDIAAGLARRLRRMADETAATETQAPHRPVSLATPCAACTHPYNWHCGQPACQFGRSGDLCGCRSFTPGEEPAAGARQDEEA